MKSAEILTLLPAVFRTGIRQGDPGDTLLRVMEALHEPSEEVLANVDSYFDPWRTPDRFVPYLATWLNLDQYFGRGRGEPVAVPQLRGWIAASAALKRWRGTAKGLRDLLEAATGVEGFTIIEGIRADGSARPFHLRVSAPAEASTQAALIERIIELEKPAFVTTEPVIFESPGTEKG